MGVKISYNDYEFTATGRAHFSRQARYEADAIGAKANRAVVTYTIHQIFTEDTFADNQARYQKMLQAIQSAPNAPEGRLKIVDEFGYTLVDVVARPKENNLPDQWGQWMAETTVAFEAIEEITDGSSATVGFSDGSFVLLKNVTGWREALRTERPTFALNNRRETNGAITASGKIVADASKSEQARRDQLQAERDAILSIDDHKDVELQFGTFDRTVRVEDVAADIKDGSYELEWSLTASYRRFPDGDFVEVEYDVSTRDDMERGERITALRGRIRASTIIEAKAKLDQINNQYKTDLRTLRRSESTEQFIDGADGADNYNEVAFTSEFREAIDVVSWNLTVSDRQDAKSGQILTTYSGKVTALKPSTALAKARSLGIANYPVLLSSNESISTSQIDSEALQFTEVTFSYEYARKGTLQYAEANSETNRETFGQSSTVVSGFATAASDAEALALARSFKPAGLQLTAKETIGTAKGVNGGYARDSITATDTPADGDKVDVNGRIYTFKAVLSGAVDEIFINGRDGSLANLEAAINGYGAPGVDYGAGTAVNVDVTANAPIDHAIELIAKAVGPGGNALALAATGDALQVLTANFTGGVTQQMGTVFSKVEFNYVFFLKPTEGSIEYARHVLKDYNTREVTTTYSGTAYGPDENTCSEFIDALIPGGVRLTKDERTANRFSAENDDELRSMTFSVSFVAPLAAGGDDILEAEMTMKTTFSVNHAVITLIPYGDPFVQAGAGTTPAVRQVSGTIVALNAQTALNWARAKRNLIAGGYEDPAEEAMTDAYFPFSGVNVKTHRCAFTYAARFARLDLG